MAWLPPKGMEGTAKRSKVSCPLLSQKAAPLVSADQHGIDAFQSLMLAQNLARTLLKGFVTDGGTLRDAECGGPVDVERLFESGA
jgi:hypothetical protein